MLPIPAFSCVLLIMNGVDEPEPITRINLEIPRGHIIYHHEGSTISTGILIQTLLNDPNQAFRHALSRRGLLATSRHYFHGQGFKSPVDHQYQVLGQLEVFLAPNPPTSFVTALSKDFDANLKITNFRPGTSVDINKFFLLFLETGPASQRGSPSSSSVSIEDPTRLSPSSIPLSLKRPSPEAEEPRPETRRRLSGPLKASSADDVLRALEQSLATDLLQRATFDRQTGSALTTFAALRRFMAIVEVIEELGFPSMLTTNNWDAPGTSVVVSGVEMTPQGVIVALGWSPTTLGKVRLIFGRSKEYSLFSWPDDQESESPSALVCFLPVQSGDNSNRI